MSSEARAKARERALDLLDLCTGWCGPEARLPADDWRTAHIEAVAKDLLWALDELDIAEKLLADLP